MFTIVHNCAHPLLCNTLIINIYWFKCIVFISFRSVQIRSDLLRSVQIRSDPLRSVQIRSGPLRFAQIRSDLLRSAQIRSDPLRSVDINVISRSVTSYVFADCIWMTSRLLHCIHPILLFESHNGNGTHTHTSSTHSWERATTLHVNVISRSVAT